MQRVTSLSHCVTNHSLLMHEDSAVAAFVDLQQPLEDLWKQTTGGMHNI